MGLVFHRRLAIPLWAIAFFTVALTASPPATLLPMPPTTLFVIGAHLGSSRSYSRRPVWFRGCVPARASSRQRAI